MPLEIATTRGRALLTFLDSHNLDIVAPFEPTHYGYYTPDILDFGLVSQLYQLPNITVLHELSSDHYPILLHLDFCTLRSIPTPLTFVNWTWYPRALQPLYL